MALPACGGSVGRNIAFEDKNERADEHGALVCNNHELIGEEVRAGREARKKCVWKERLLAAQKDAVGRKIKVLNSTERTYFKGSIVGFEETSGMHFILFDNGEADNVKRLDLSKMRWRYIDLVGERPIGSMSIETSKYIGVWRSSASTWKAFTQPNNPRRVCIGAFMSERDAALAHDFYARQTNSRLNFPNEMITEDDIQQRRIKTRENHSPCCGNRRREGKEKKHNDRSDNSDHCRSSCQQKSSHKQGAGHASPPGFAADTSQPLDRTTAKTPPPARRELYLDSAETSRVDDQDVIGSQVARQRMDKKPSAVLGETDTMNDNTKHSREDNSMLTSKPEGHNLKLKPKARVRRKRSQDDDSYVSSDCVVVTHREESSSTGVRRPKKRGNVIGEEPPVSLVIKQKRAPKGACSGTVEVQNINTSSVAWTDTTESRSSSSSQQHRTKKSAQNRPEQPKERCFDKEGKYGVGTRFRKHFPGHGTYDGRVLGFDGDRYAVSYCDGDGEDISEDELDHLVRFDGDGEVDYAAGDELDPRSERDSASQHSSRQGNRRSKRACSKRRKWWFPQQKYSIGTRFEKAFDNGRRYTGQVTGFDGEHYAVYYSEDGDCESLSETDLDDLKTWCKAPTAGRKQKDKQTNCVATEGLPKSVLETESAAVTQQAKYSVGTRFLKELPDVATGGLPRSEPRNGSAGVPQQGNYPIGTRFLKDLNFLGPCEGEIVGFNGGDYSIRYFDVGISETLKESELDMLGNKVRVQVDPSGT